MPPACTECRRRKLGCSKEFPICKECRRISATCYYEPKEKPGLKSGAVENLNRRVTDKIELILEELQQQIKSVPYYRGPESSYNSSPQIASDLLQFLGNRLQNFRETNQNPQEASFSNSTPTNLNDLHFSHPPMSQISSESKKRKHGSSGEVFEWGEQVLDSLFTCDKYNMSSAELLEAVIQSYFSQVHPWLPMLHEIDFRRQLSAQVYWVNLEVILHAMVVVALKFVSADRTADFNHISQFTKRSRDWVMLHALNSLSVENLQALLMIAFDDIGRGEATSAWSTVGSLTRTVEYLQLSVEVDDDDAQPLLKPCPSIPPPSSWTEMETRRRVFWTVFNIDRFCSVVTGWNTSLTSYDVHRRLPVDGVKWRKQEPVLAPYFGIWDKSAGRIGNSITFLPKHYPSPSQSTDVQSPSIATDIGQSSQIDGLSTIGAFAYAIEATESMSRVTTYFLQQNINFQDQSQVGSWLTRFKELDLRLIHWKMLLPQKWKDTNLSRQPAKIVMDPNLTLAHITHNASMILLHQLIAYPPGAWYWASKLPSRCSADTCQSAAVETSSITENYVRNPVISKIVNSQFIFCVFVAARVLLIHWRYYMGSDPLPEFFKLVNSLDMFSTRWEGALQRQRENHPNLAAKYANHLRHMHHQCMTDPKYRIDVLAYASEFGSRIEESPINATSAERSPETNVGKRVQRKPNNVEAQEATKKGEDAAAGWGIKHPKKMIKETSVNQLPDMRQGQAQLPQSASPFGPQLQPRQGIYDSTGPTVLPSKVPGAADDNMLLGDFSTISQMFLDQQFLEMDRVISYDDGMFTAHASWWGGQDN